MADHALPAPPLSAPLSAPLTEGSKFAEAPAEVRAFFAAKQIKPSWHWQDFDASEHAHAFTVAKTLGYDVIDDIHAALKTAIDSQQDYATFAKNLTPTLQAKGWWGQAEAEHPATGVKEAVQLGSPRRLRTIYWANSRTAYAAGQWTRIQATKRLLPYLEYLHTVAARPRPEHLAWVGTVLHADDVWWESHYPPNGWMCQCRVRQLSRGEAEGRLTPDPPADFGHRRFMNRRDGTLLSTPTGIDPGWATNPGMTRLAQASQFMAGRLAAAPPLARAQAIADIVASPLFRMMAEGAMGYNASDKSPAMRDLRKFALPIAQLPAPLVARLQATNNLVTLSVATCAKQLISRAGQKFSLAYYVAVQKMIEDPNSQMKWVDKDLEISGEFEGRLIYAVIRRAQKVPGEIRLVSVRDDGRSSMKAP